MGYVEELIKVYTLAHTNLVSIIAKKATSGTLYLYERNLLKQVNQEIEKLNKYTEKWGATNIPKAYKQGTHDVMSHLKKLGAKQVLEFGSFNKLHKEAIETIVREATLDLQNANMFVGRTIKDQIRQSTLEVTAQSFATGRTVQQAKTLIIERLIKEGINGIRTKNGRTINLESYASTVARSVRREATNTAMINHLTYNNYDLVKMSEHGTTCPICAPLEGRVYSISGTSSKYPSLDHAYTGSHANIHPNCKHVLMPYIPELADSPKKDMVFSNRDFDIDPRSKKQLDQYNQKQEQTRILRQDKNQWERYRLSVKETPKTFSAFRRMKKADNEKFKELERNYKGRNVENATQKGKQ